MQIIHKDGETPKSHILFAMFKSLLSYFIFLKENKSRYFFKFF